MKRLQNALLPTLSEDQLKDLCVAHNRADGDALTQCLDYLRRAQATTADGLDGEEAPVEKAMEKTIDAAGMRAMKLEMKRLQNALLPTLSEDQLKDLCVAHNRADGDALTQCLEYL